MFFGATSFNGDVSGWSFPNVTNMLAMFSGATSFNGNVSNWSFPNVTSMREMFYQATSFNGDVSGWSFPNVTNMVAMFSRATSFNQSLGAWDISSVTNMRFMLDNSGLSTANYDATLNGWATLDASETKIPTGISLGASGLNYCNGETARNTLTNTYNWTITDAGKLCNATWTAGAWNPSVPSVGVNATIDDDYDLTADGAFGAGNLTINSGRTVTINSGESVEISGDLINNGSIIVENGGAFIQTNSTPSNSGAGVYTVNRLADNDHAVYNYFSSPVIGETASDVFGGTGKNFYTFDASIQDWAG